MRTARVALAGGVAAGMALAVAAHMAAVLAATRGQSADAGQTGTASWYGPRHDGKRTASGERFDMDDFTAAHPSFPFGTMVKVTSLRTGRSVIVRINDRFPSYRGRVIDLSKAAAREIGLMRRGTGRVRVEVLDRSVSR